MKRFWAIVCLLAGLASAFAQTSSLEEKLVNAFQYVDEPTFYANKKANDCIVDQFSQGNYSAVLSSAHSYLQSRTRMIEQMFSKLSEQERADLTILVDGDLIFHYILSAAYLTGDYSVMGDVYDYLLFVKQLLLRTTQQQKHAFPTDHVTWRDVQKRLGNGEAAIEFVSFNVFEGEKIKALHLYAAMVITRDSKQPVMIPMTTEKNLTRWQNPSDLYAVNKYGAAMGQLVWLEILNYLYPKDITTIYFAPWGVLNQMAIEALPYDKESTMNYRYNLTRLTSTRELVKQHNHYPAKTAVLFGDLFYRASAEAMQQTATTRSAVYPLAASKEEIAGIKQILDDKGFLVRTYTKKQGTEESFKAMDSHSPSILHLSTHGFVDRPKETDAMRRSGLILSYGARAWEGKLVPKDAEDGILTAAEIAALDLSGTDIVVLSACNTALGEVTAEGVWGLQRAFKLAGVQTIVMSLWAVDDEATAVLMQYFYEELMKERRALAKAAAIDSNIAERFFDYTHSALARAQHRMQQHPKYSDPYYWAGFVVVD